MGPEENELDFGGILRALSAVQEELLATADADLGRRRQLRDREDQLRVQLRSCSAGWPDHLSIDQVRRRIADVEDRIEAHYGNRLSHTAGAQTGYGGGLDPKYLHMMNRAMDRSNDLAGMKAELTRLRDRLATLERR